MRRKLIYLGICMPLCLALVPDRTPVALSITPTTIADYKDDGQSLPDEDHLASLAKQDPVAFLEACLKKQCREVRSYSGVLNKQERIKGKDNAPEVIDFWFQEKPYSVLLKWREGARAARASLYVQGQNKERAAILPKLIGLVTDIDPEGSMAKGAGRYSIREFSMRQGTERTLHAWQAAQDNCRLNVEYLGKKPVPELDGRVCYLLKRTCDPPEEEGLVTLEVAVDAETWMQAGSTLRDGEGHLIGRYFFTDLKVNPTLPDNLFERASLKK